MTSPSRDRITALRKCSTRLARSSSSQPRSGRPGSPARARPSRLLAVGRRGDPVPSRLRRGSRRRSAGRPGGRAATRSAARPPGRGPAPGCGRRPARRPVRAAAGCRGCPAGAGTGWPAGCGAAARRGVPPRRSRPAAGPAPAPAPGLRLTVPGRAPAGRCGWPCRPAAAGRAGRRGSTARGPAAGRASRPGRAGRQPEVGSGAEVQRGGPPVPGGIGQRARPDAGVDDEHDDAVGHQHDRGGAAVGGRPQRRPGRRAGRPAWPRRTGRAGPRWPGRSRAGSASCWLISASWAGSMPRPRSSISMANPLATRSARTSTRVPDGENMRRVLDQLGQQVDHVRDGRGGHRVLGRGQHGDPPVVLDLRHGAADDVDDRHRLASRTGRAPPRTGWPGSPRAGASGW